ncbi:hypothetical protein J1605_017097 [Eschrichtius robustus]|uniref:WH1 domain-containing protein n=1 Tax=Eschrichtius robustus TaxID=9764 RepID=A0AB34I3H8_ESCRO|nr:hypothetical protein J1605_017097 [Eschrichtius robustus]
MLTGRGLHRVSQESHQKLPTTDREQPIFTTRAHVFQIDPSTKKNWVPASKQAVTVSYFYDVTRNSYRIISVDGAKVSVPGELGQGWVVEWDLAVGFSLHDPTTTEQEAREASTDQGSDECSGSVEVPGA